MKIDVPNMVMKALGEFKYGKGGELLIGDQEGGRKV